MFVYAGLYSIWGTDNNYMYLLIPTNIVAIANAYICYKLFVFKTKGNIVKECFKCYLVYGVGAGLGALFTYFMVQGCSLYPSLANAISVVIITLFSFVGHKLFSFRKSSSIS